MGEKMHGMNRVKPYEQLQRIGRDTAELLEKAENERNAVAAYDCKALGELVTSLSAFCDVGTWWKRSQWDEFEKMVNEAALFPYPLYRPLMKSNLIIILSSL